MIKVYLVFRSFYANIDQLFLYKKHVLLQGLCLTKEYQTKFIVNQNKSQIKWSSYLQDHAKTEKHGEEANALIFQKVGVKYKTTFSKNLEGASHHPNPNRCYGTDLYIPQTNSERCQTYGALRENS